MADALNAILGLHMNIVLGSQSQGRQLALQQAGIQFSVLPINIDEKAIRSDDYTKLPLLLARAKGDAAQLRISEPVLVITADTVMIYRGELREKPESAAQAAEYLRSYNAETPVFAYTGVVVTNTRTGQRVDGSGTRAAYLRPIPEPLIGELITSGKAFQWAGGFAVQEPLFEPYVERIEGSPDGVWGLPLDLTLRLLRKAQG